MLNRFEYTPDHEKDWQKQDRETGPLSGFQEEKQTRDCASKFGRGPITVEAGSSGEYFFRYNATITIHNDGLHPDGLLVYYDVYGLSDQCDLQPNISNTGSRQIDAAVLPMSRKAKNISPGRSHSNGFLLRVDVPAQAARNGNSARCYVTVEAN